MVDDLISRQDAIDAIKAIPDLSIYAYCSFLEMLTKLPSAQPERKKGKWTLNKDGNWACPFCEFDPYHDEMNGMNYCPNCGARLEGFDNGKVH